jgi:hypothetical protein
MVSFSSLFFVNGGFLSGAARTFNLGGGTRPRTFTPAPAHADLLAIYADWRAVGQDLKQGVGQAKIWADETQPTLFDLREADDQ